jgi:hypothetical protein
MFEGMSERAQENQAPSDLVLHNFSILKPVVAPPRLQNLSILPCVNDPGRELAFIWEGRLSPSDPMALDIETKGNDPADLTSVVVGVGLADARGSVYIDFRECDPNVWPFLLFMLDKHRIPLIAHNLFFDASYVMRDLRAAGHPTGWLNWQHCTYALYKLLASEGWAGQRWGLKEAQVDLLGWEQSNDKLLKRWLVENGHTTRPIAKATLEKLQPHLKGGTRDMTFRWDLLTEEEEQSLLAAADKSKMHLAPPRILGFYTCQDADATYLLYTLVLQPALERFRALQDYASPARYGSYIHMLIDGRLGGIQIDRPKLEAYSQELAAGITQAKKSFLVHPEVAPAIAEYNRRVVQEHYLAEPEKFLKQKVRPPAPPMHTKSGKISKNYTKWLENGPKYEVPVISKNWRKWWDRLLVCMDEQHFNLDSGPQKQWLFYEYLKHRVELTTDSGQPAVDERALKQFGEPGALLITYNEQVKELSYVEACLEHLREGGTSTAVPAIHRIHAGRFDAPAIPGGWTVHPAFRVPGTGPGTDGANVTWTVHPAFRVPGTLTGRLAGAGGLNIQQVPKTRGYLECYVARPGKVWVDCDHTALEQVVLAELSQDASLWKLYGPGAAPNDVYLFTGSYLPGLGSKIRAAGYNPDAPTVEGISAAKKACKKERAVSKIVTLGSSYGMGAPKLQRTLRLEGIDISLEEAQRIHAGYWQLYRGVKEFEAELLRQMDLNGGWVLNGIGRPVGIANGYERDIVNRVVQSTGHDCHIFYIQIFTRMLNDAGIPWSSIILDMHDQAIIEVDEKHAETVKEIMGVHAYRELNAMLNGRIPLRGEANIVRNLAEAKVAE